MPYALQTNAPGYPASTWPLKREQIPSTLVEPQVSVQNVRVTPYINGLFGFGALKNKIIRKHEQNMKIHKFKIHQFYERCNNSFRSSGYFILISF